MDLVAIAQAITTTLAPLLPYLLKAGEKAAEEAGKQVGGEAWDWAKDIWARLRPKVEAKPLALQAAREIELTPDDKDVQAMLRVQLKKLLTEDQALAKEAQQWFEKAKAAGVIVVASGEKSVAIDGDVSGSTIVTGVEDAAVVGSKVDGDVVARDKITQIYQAASPAATALHQLPPPVSDFTGRAEELAELTTKLLRGGVTISGLYGFGGIGKTALALKLADQLKSQYPDAQLYLDLKGASREPLAVAEALAHVIRAYHPTAKLPESEAELFGLYQSVLEGQRALLLMDNAASASQVEPLIPPASCVLIVTSRQHFTLPGLFAKNLEVLSPNDGHNLLVTISPRIGEHSVEIAKLCGYLPLALRLAGSALMKFVNLTPADYACRLKDGQRRLELIEASLNLSYELLSEELQKWWRLLAVFPDTFEEMAAAAVWNLEADTAQDVLGELIASSMVEWNESARRYRLHDLARVFANSRLKAEEWATGQRLHATHYQAVLAAADGIYGKGGESVKLGLDLFDLEWRNIEVGRAWAETEAVAQNQAAQLCVTYSEAGADVLHLRQHPGERIRWLETSVRAARYLNLRNYEGAALGNLGLAHATLGDTRKAIQLFEQALNIAKELGSDREGGIALGNLGLAYTSLGETNRAIEYLEQSLSIARETNDRRAEGNALGNLGNIYLSMDDNRKAIDHYEQVLDIAREIGNRQLEGNTLGNLGVAYKNLGDIPRAIHLSNQLLHIHREIGDRLGQANALGNLGSAFALSGEAPRAIEFYEQQLSIVRELGYRRGEGNAIFNKSLALNAVGRRAEAIVGAEEALAIYEQIEDPNAAKVRRQLAQWDATPK